MLFKILKKKNDGYLINDIIHFYNYNNLKYSYQSAGDLVSLLTSCFSLKKNVHEHESNSSDTFSISSVFLAFCIHETFLQN